MLDIDENWNPEPYISQNITKNILKISFHLGHIKESIEKVFQPGRRGGRLESAKNGTSRNFALNCLKNVH